MTGYKETLATEDEAITSEIPLDDNDELSFEDDEEGTETEVTADIDTTLLEESAEEPGNKKVKPQPFSLQARRAIEDHLEQRRLRKELDYLYDDEFAQTDETKKS